MHPVHLDLLRALFRLQRYRRTADVAALELRVPLDRAALRASLRALATAGAVSFDEGGQPRLTLVGLALAAASAGMKPQRRPVSHRTAA